jgi:hypothetical protein
VYFDVHGPARTSPAVREQIRQSSASHAELARRYGVSVQTIRKWRRRDSPVDGSHRPKRLQTTLDGAQEDLVVGLRIALRLSLDRLLTLGRRYVCQSLTRSALDRTLRRRGVSSLADLKPQWPIAQRAQTSPRTDLLSLIPIRYGSDGLRRVHVLIALSSAGGQVRLTCCRQLTGAFLGDFVQQLAAGSALTLIGPDGVARPVTAGESGGAFDLTDLRRLLTALKASAREIGRTRAGRVDAIAERVQCDAGFRPPHPDTLPRWQECLSQFLATHRSVQPM